VCVAIPNFKFPSRMSSRKRRHGDFSSSGSDTDDERSKVDKRRKATKIKGVNFTRAGPQINLGRAHVTTFNLNVTIVNDKGNAQKLDSVRRQQRRQKAREKREQECESAEKAEERRQAEEQRRQAEAAERLEQRRRRYVEYNGEDISTAEFKRVEEHEIQRRRQSGRSSIDASGQARIHAYFRPRSIGDDVESHQSEVHTIAERLNEWFELLDFGCPGTALQIRAIVNYSYS
jgi:hypothetical protein